MRPSINYSGFVDIVASGEPQGQVAGNQVSAAMDERPHGESITPSQLPTSSMDEADSNELG